MDLEVTAHKVGRWYREQEPKNALRPKLPRLTVTLAAIARRGLMQHMMLLVEFEVAAPICHLK